MRLAPIMANHPLQMINKQSTLCITQEFTQRHAIPSAAKTDLVSATPSGGHRVDVNPRVKSLKAELLLWTVSTTLDNDLIGRQKNDLLAGTIETDFPQQPQQNHEFETGEPEDQRSALYPPEGSNTQGNHCTGDEQPFIKRPASRLVGSEQYLAARRITVTLKFHHGRTPGRRLNTILSV